MRFVVDTMSAAPAASTWCRADVAAMFTGQKKDDTLAKAVVKAAPAKAVGAAKTLKAVSTKAVAKAAAATALGDLTPPCGRRAPRSSRPAHTKASVKASAVSPVLRPRRRL